MAEVIQTKVVAVSLQGNSVHINLESGEPVQTRQGLERWRVGSRVYKIQGMEYTCLDEIEEDEVVRGQCNPLGDCYYFQGDNRIVYIIPSQQVTASLDPANPAFLIRKNNKLYILNRENADHLQMKAVTEMLDKCAFCQRSGDSPPNGIGECNHKMHEGCLLEYVKKRKTMCCPQFCCRRPFSQEIVEWAVKQL